MLATRQAAEGPEIQALALRVLLLIAAQPGLARPLLRANVADLCRSLLNVREPVEVRLHCELLHAKLRSQEIQEGVVQFALRRVTHEQDPPTHQPLGGAVH